MTVPEQAEGKTGQERKVGIRGGGGCITAVVVRISAHAANNLLLFLPSLGPTICMAGRRAKREQESKQPTPQCASAL